MQIDTHSNQPSIFAPVHLDTEHVKIRPLSQITWQMLADGLLYENSFHALNWGIKTPEDVRSMYESALQGPKQQRGNPIVFLNLAETEVVGMTNFMNIEPQNQMLEIGGTWIGKKWQRTFVNSETKLALLTYCFEQLKLNRVEFKIDAKNLVSQRAVQRLGFHYDGFLPRRKLNKNGEVRDYVLYSVDDLTWTGVKNQIQDLLQKSQSPAYKEIQRIQHLRSSKKSEEAFAELLMAIETHPTSADLFYLAACICDGERTEKEAVPFYLKALDLGLHGVDRRGAYLGLGSTYRSLGMYEESKAVFERAQKEFSDYRPFAVFLALTEYNLGNFPAAIKLLLDVLLHTTNDQEVRAYGRALEFYSTRLNEVFE